MAIPVKLVSEMPWSHLTTKIAMSIFGLCLFLIRKLILNRLIVIANHITDVASLSEYSTLQHLKINGKDEIHAIAYGFNSLSDKLKKVYGSLETQVKERTADLEEKNKELKQEIINRTQTQELLDKQEAT